MRMQRMRMERFGLAWSGLVSEGQIVQLVFGPLQPKLATQHPLPSIILNLGYNKTGCGFLLRIILQENENFREVKGRQGRVKSVPEGE